MRSRASPSTCGTRSGTPGSSSARPPTRPSRCCSSPAATSSRRRRSSACARSPATAPSCRTSASTPCVQWRKRPLHWLRLLLAECEERWTRAGEVSSLLEPNLKDGRGGLRDRDVLHWAVATGRDDVIAALEAPLDELEGPAGVLHAVRCELHRVTGRPGNVFMLQEQDAVARAIRVPDARGDADVLMRRVLGRRPRHRLGRRAVLEARRPRPERSQRHPPTARPPRADPGCGPGRRRARHRRRGRSRFATRRVVPPPHRRRRLPPRRAAQPPRPGGARRPGARRSPRPHDAVARAHTTGVRRSPRQRPGDGHHGRVTRALRRVQPLPAGMAARPQPPPTQRLPPVQRRPSPPAGGGQRQRARAHGRSPRPAPGGRR